MEVSESGGLTWVSSEGCARTKVTFHSCPLMVSVPMTSFMLLSVEMAPCAAEAAEGIRDAVCSRATGAFYWEGGGREAGKEGDREGGRQRQREECSTL